ncbi:cyclin-like protein [Coniophora puteana RWD-64-598 SS2]|uniref:Cyclin-like protein n=1 Tax=Coniophora puteana (strain RWD-64-598) TaxID=741705 RepID=A0A5M3MRU6_CONPW|nr:cyclin-like protein [Coniophora puteana RWD-64-598 SS2]EIW81820.1 cyclin-like protein [Coniophora puteana RWD-64-598 SS2]
MATDFWASSHYKRWIVDRDTLRQARAEDLAYVDDATYIDFFNVFFANVIMKLGKRLNLRQRVIATATVFFKRFYLKNALCETDPFTVIAACCYVAAKAEESPVHIKNVVSEARMLFSQPPYGLKYFASDNSKLAEMEFYLVGDLECDLTVFHPYRTLAALCRKAPPEAVGTEAGELGELGVGIVDGPRFWGAGPGDWQLELGEGALQLAWSVINDTYRSDLPLLYPPHLLAIAALYLALVLDGPTRERIEAQASQPQDATHGDSTPRRSSRQARQTSVHTLSQSDENQESPSPIEFFANLNVSMPLITTIAQEMLVLYKRMERYRDDAVAVPAVSASVPVASAGMAPGGMNMGIGGAGGIGMNVSMGMNMSGSAAFYMASQAAQQAQSHGSPFGSGGGRRGVSGSDSRAGSRLGTPAGTPDVSGTGVGVGMGGGGGVSSIVREGVVTAGMLMQVLMRMRESRLSDMAHPPTGRPVAVNKMLERTLAVG